MRRKKELAAAKPLTDPGVLPETPPVAVSKAATGGIKTALRSRNVTHCIDILLALLIIFMVIQPTTQHELEARIPQAESEAAAAPAIVIHINADWEIAVNRESVAFSDLGKRLFEIFRARSDRRMFIQAVDEPPFGAVARVIDVAKGAGAGDVGLLLER